GQIIATAEDYTVVSELLADIFSEGVGATVSPATRETVLAVSRLLADGTDAVSISALAQLLKLDKSAASRRAASAVQQGHLRNLEDRKGRPARLVLAEPLPDSVSILPSCEALHGCSADRGDVHAPAPRKGC